MIFLGDNKDILPTLESESVDLVVTSPPYDGIRQYGGYAWDFNFVAQELKRVLKVGGVTVWIIGDQTINGSETGSSFRQALYFMELGFNLHDTMIYAKQNPPPKNHRRYEQAFEYMFVFSKGIPKTFNALKEPCKRAGERVTGTMRNEDKDTLQKKHGYGQSVKQMKLRSNIWTYKLGKNYGYVHQHPAIMPEQLAIDCVLTWSSVEDMVLDPFCGSGTVLVAALKCGREAVGIEISSNYVEIARRRLTEMPTMELLSEKLTGE